MRDHEILEEIEEQREKGIDASCLRIVVKIFDYLVSLEDISADDGCPELKTVEVLAHPYLVLNDLWRNPLVTFWQTEDDFVQLAGQSAEIGTDAVGNELGGLLVDGDLSLAEILLDKGWQSPFLQLHALEEYASLLDGLHVIAFLAVHLAVFMAHYEDG